MQSSISGSKVDYAYPSRAVADLFFGGLDELQKRIRQLLHSGEVPIVKLFGYMQGALKNQNGPWYLPRTIPIDPAIIQR